MIKNFTQSNKLLKKVLEVIPLGSQTFSKSYIQYPQNLSPLFIQSGQGARVRDIDGNSFIDLVSGLMSNVLGYNDEDVNNAIINQLHHGISFSLPTELEYELAQLLTEIIPCAEMVRFGKTGTDVTSAAVRLSRAYTKRDKILVCGYHGWQDWYIGTTTRNLGIPNAVSQMTDTVPYNDLDSLEQRLKTRDYAAFIMEPTNVYKPEEGYLEKVRALTTQYNTILVFDEIVTGFHFALGGAQSYFGVTPDLACFGKGLGNGMPISAIVGKREIMALMDEIFFSGTFGGETLSIAAGIAVIKKMRKEPVINHLWAYGKNLSNKVQNLIDQFGLNDTIKTNGYSPWKIITFEDFKDVSANALRTFFQKEMIARGVLILTSHNISYAMGDNELQEIEDAYKNVFEKMKESLTKNSLIAELECPIIQPIFKVR